MSPSRAHTPSSVVGLDIGNDSIKVAEAKYTKDGISITALGIARTPEGAIENEIIVDPQAMGKAIKAVLAESGIKTKTCVSSVAGQSQVVVRVVDVPKMSREELAETMKWEVEKFSFSPDGVEMDFQPLDRPGADPDAQNMGVLLAVAQRELVERHVEALTVAGLRPSIVDVELLASGRSLLGNSQNGAGDDVVAIIDIGANNTEMGIFEGGSLTFPSPPLTIAGVSFTREIASALGQTMEEAEITKKEYAIVDMSGFGAGGPADNHSANGGGSSEPTSFDTSFGPGIPFASAFDVDVPAAAPQEEAPAVDAAPLGGFHDTIDGPVFDSPDAIGVPAFDLDDVAAAPASAGPSFDLDDSGPGTAAGPTFDLGDVGQAEASGPTFDLGGDDAAQPQAIPAFDLGDDDAVAPATEEPVSPAFDLTDMDPVADFGAPVFTQEPVQAPAAIPVQAGSMEESVFQAISSVLVDLANELRRSLDYYYVNNSKMPERIILCGGTAKMPRLGEFLSHELGVPVEVADPVKTLAVNTPAISGPYLREISPLFSVSIGLAIRDMIG